MHKKEAKNTRTQENKAGPDRQLRYPSLVKASFTLGFFLRVCVCVFSQKHLSKKVLWPFNCSCATLLASATIFTYLLTYIHMYGNVIVVASFYSWDLSICLLVCRHKYHTSGLNGGPSATRIPNLSSLAAKKYL